MQPWALWGLLAAAGAVLVHLLFRARATRIPFPSLRFIRTRSVAAVRLRRPSDLLLLVVRTSILGLAALAIAQPVLISAARTRTWDSRTARAIVVDARDGERARAAAADESRSAYASVRIDTADLPAGMRQAAEWLDAAPPARREIVVISAFRRGTLSNADIARVPARLGLRFTRAGTLPLRQQFVEPWFGQEKPGTLRVQLDGAMTTAELVRSTSPAAGLEIIAPHGSEAAVAELRRVVAAAGAPAADAREPIVVSLGGAQVAGPLQPIRRAWMLQAALAMQQNSDLADGARRDAPSRLESGAPWVSLFRQDDGAPLVRVAASGDRLVVDVAAMPADLTAASALRAALLARVGRIEKAGQEVLSLTDAELASWQRPAAPVPADAWRRVETSDARWCWAMVLLLLGVESALRRQRRQTGEEMADAA